MQRRQFLTGLVGIIAAPTIIVRGIIRSTAPTIILPTGIERPSRYYKCVVAGSGTPGPYGNGTWLPIGTPELDSSVYEVDARFLNRNADYKVGDVVRIDRTNGETHRLRKPEIIT